jgi:thiopurine S-methyltransferase
MTDAPFWKGRWQRGEIGWHQTEVEPRLVENWSGIAPTRVFVPLCGKTLDLEWLHQQGHEVIGVELSEIACRAFFEERGIQPCVTTEGAFQVYRAQRYTLYQGDFFELTPERLGLIGAIYDRASLIALPRAIRNPYAQKIISLLQHNAAAKPQVLQITLERLPHDEQGPPHSVRPQEVEELYGSALNITRLSEETLPEKSPSGAGLKEWVFLLKLKT